MIETTSGALLLYRGNWFRATHGGLYTQHASAHPIGPDAAIAAVNRAHPAFHASWVSRDDGAWVVGNAAYQTVYGVDPGTGHVNGGGDTNAGPMGFLANLHDCALTCPGYPGGVSWLGKPVPTLGMTFLTDITWGGLVLGLLGLLMILLGITGIVTWWPGRKRLAHGFRVRAGKGRFARDYDLHNVIGIVAVPFVLMWGITGAAFEFPVVEKAWLAITDGDQPTDVAFALAPNPAAKRAPAISTAQATSAALAQVPGEARFVGLPGPGLPYYEIDVKSGYASYSHRAIYSGDAYVLVDAHDASNVKVIDNGHGPLANRFYDKVLEPTHFGWGVDSWWRIVWFVLGMAPLALGVTGVSTWLYRRGARKRRRARVAA